MTDSDLGESTVVDSPRPRTAKDLAESLLDLHDPVQPARRLPSRLLSILPSPLVSLDNWKRFRHEDLEEMTPAERAWEAIRLRTAAACLNYDRIPAWVLVRLNLLDGQPSAGGGDADPAS